MCPRLPETRPFNQNSCSSSSTHHHRPQHHRSPSNLAERSGGTSTPHTPAPLSSTEHLALDTFIDHLLTGGSSLAASSESSLNHMNSSEPPPQQQHVHNTLFGYPMPVDLFSALYTGAVATGGLVGYLKAGSKPSLAAGLLFGSLLGYGTYLTSVNPDNYYLTLGIIIHELSRYHDHLTYLVLFVFFKKVHRPCSPP